MKKITEKTLVFCLVFDIFVHKSFTNNLLITNLEVHMAFELFSL